MSPHQWVTLVQRSETPLAIIYINPEANSILNRETVNNDFAIKDGWDFLG